MATADILLGVFCMPFTLIGQMLRNFIFGYIMCKLVPYFQAVSVSVSVWTLVSISLERYFAICRPLKSRSWQTRSHAYKAITGVWLGSLTLCLPVVVLTELIAIGDENSGRHKCRDVWDSQIAEQTYNIVLLLLLFIIPLLVMGVAYTMVAWRLWEGLGLGLTSNTRTECSSLQEYSQSESSSTASTGAVRVLYQAKQKKSDVTNMLSAGSYDIDRRKSTLVSTSIYSTIPRKDFSKTRDHQKVVFLRSNDSQVGFQINQHGMRSTYTRRSVMAKKKIIIMLYVIVIEFFICWTPIWIINAWSVFDIEIYRYIDPNCITLMHLLAYASSCCNPITYGFMNVQFRTAFLAVFQCHHSRRRNSFIIHRMVDRSLSDRGVQNSVRNFFTRKPTIKKGLKESETSPSTDKKSQHQS
ncbi:cholecystokinin receptor type A-like isoform X2 [Artemia franciscana]|uniref:cholecystokinin receptor type A-like isoform X2 n=1 Tax=Artemia franciscana TaxID=6661 RepID=UPI0032DA18F1